MRGLGAKTAAQAIYLIGVGVLNHCSKIISLRFYIVGIDTAEFFDKVIQDSYHTLLLGWDRVFCHKW